MHLRISFITKIAKNIMSRIEVILMVSNAE